MSNPRSREVATALETRFPTLLMKRWGEKVAGFGHTPVQAEGTLGARPFYFHYVNVNPKNENEVFVNEAPFRVDFWVSEATGSPKFFNIIIEGVNMLLSERTEVQAMLDQRGGDLDRLIADLSRM